jgi:hypothetical protein
MRERNYPQSIYSALAMVVVLNKPRLVRLCVHKASADVFWGAFHVLAKL